jgi:thiol-disulfide isomerase/thioredoxin
MQRCIIILLSIFVIGCQAKKTEEKSSPKEKEIMLIGAITPSDFTEDPYLSWYDSVYHAYTPALDSLIDFKSELSALDIELFFGTWCSDSRRELPAFHKIFDELAIDKTRIKHVALDRDKVEPENSQDGKNIEFVPTIIFYKGDSEIGRIIESPVNSLEIDIKGMLVQLKE